MTYTAKNKPKSCLKNINIIFRSVLKKWKVPTEILKNRIFFLW